MSWWSEKTIKQAVLLSLMAHGLLLFVYRLPELSSATHSVLNATLGQQPAEKEARVERVTAPELPALKRLLKPVIQKSEVITSTVATADSHSVLAAEPQVAVPRPAEPARTQEGGDGAVVSAPTDAVKEYRLMLARQARRLKSYPSLARQRAWEGNVDILLSHLRGGAVGVMLKRSSGYELLDTQALTMLERAVKLVELPPVLAEKNFQMTLNVEYRLDEE